MLAKGLDPFASYKRSAFSRVILLKADRLMLMANQTIL
jgi:hypothetical protein